MYWKNISKLLATAIVIVSVLLLGGAITGAGAFSVDVTHLEYANPNAPTQPSRSITYDFSAGDPPSSNTITIPTGFVTTTLPFDTGFSFTFGAYPDARNDLSLSLDTTNKKGTLSSALKGICVISSTAPGLPVPQSATPDWTFAVQLQNFTGMTDVTKIYNYQIGFGSPAPGPHPQLTAAWIPTAGGGRNLVLNAQIYDDSINQIIWPASPTPVTVPAADPSTISIKLRVRSLPLTSGNMIFDYSLDGGATWATIDTLVFPFPAGQVPNIFPHLSFPAKFPYVNLWAEPQTGGGGPVISYNGLVKSMPEWPALTNMVPINGATVSTEELPGALSTTTDSTGAFHLLGIPQSTTFRIAIQPPQGSGYVPALSRDYNWNADIWTSLAFVLFTQAQYDGFGNTSGTGMVFGRVARQDNPMIFLAGATIEARELIPGTTPPALGASYPVTYSTGGSATGPDGIYLVKNVPAGKLVQLVAMLTNYAFLFNAAVVPVQAGAVSEESFLGTPIGAGTTISFSGSVKDNASPSQPISGATVEQAGVSTVMTQTDGTGAFVLTGLPAGSPFSLKISKDASFATTYTAVFNSPADIVSAPWSTFTLFPANQLSTWGVAAGKGIIRTLVRDGGGNFIGGVVITAQSQLGKTYTVCYDDTCTGLTSTQGGSGRFVIKDVEPGDTVTVTAQKNGVTFNSRIYPIFADGIHQGVITGTGGGTKVSYSSFIKDNQNPAMGIEGVPVEQVNASPANSVTSGVGGAFTIDLPYDTPVYLKSSKTGFAPTYSANMRKTANELDNNGFTLFPTSQLATWGVAPGKGIIRSRVKDQSELYIGGAVVTAQSQLGRTYAICYDDACSPNLTSTRGDSGRYIVKDVDPGDVVTVTAEKAGWTFNQRTFHTYADSVHQGGVTGSPSGPTGVSGTLSYTGSQTGSFKLRLSSADMMMRTTIDASLASPGNFTFNNVPGGKYYLSVYRDSDNNGNYSPGEPYGYYQDGNGLKTIAVGGTAVTGIAVSLIDPFTSRTGISVTIASSFLNPMPGYLVLFRQGDSILNNMEPLTGNKVIIPRGVTTFDVVTKNGNFEGMPLPAGKVDFYFLTGDLDAGPVKGIVQNRQLGLTITQGQVLALNPVTFNTGGTVSGQVKSSSISAGPIWNARVSLVSLPDPAHPENYVLTVWGNTDQNGNFLFENVPVGNYYLRISPYQAGGYNDFTPIAVNVTQNGQTIALPPESTRLTSLFSPAAISGTFTPAGAGVENRVVVMKGDMVVARATPSATDGSFTIGDLLPDTYDVVGSARGFIPQKVSVTLAANENKKQDFALAGQKEMIVKGLQWLLDHQRADGSLDDNLTGVADQFVFGWTGYAGLTLLSVYENPKYSDAASPDYIGDALKAKIHDALYGVVSGDTVTRQGIKQYFEGTYHAADFAGTPWDDTGAFFNDTVAWSSVAATPVALEKLIALGVPLSDPKIVNSVKFLLNAQVTVAKASDPAFIGGWRYNPQNTDSDNWETAWVIMALMKAGVNPSVPAIVDGLNHIKRSQVTTGFGAGLFHYMPNEIGESGPLGTTAASILALNFAGAPRNDEYVNRFFEWTKSNAAFQGFSRYADAYWWSMFPWAASLYPDPDHTGKTMYDTLDLAWNMADEILLLQNQTDGYWENTNYSPGGSNSGNRVMYTASALMALAPYAKLAPRPEEVNISGAVKDHLGNVLSGATVEAILNDIVRAEATTDAAGAYTLNVPKGYAFSIRVQSYGYLRVTRTGTVDGSTNATGIDLQFAASDVDTTPPAISGNYPAASPDIMETRPEIGAMISDSGSGVDPASIILTLDGQAVNAVYVGGKATYRPMSDLTLGTHQVTINASDYAGLRAPEFSWTFKIAVPMFKFSPSQLTNAGKDDFPAWSPDGTKIAFASNRDGNYDIWVINADGSGSPTKLTTGTLDKKYPSWSPDGTKIAYIIHDPNNPNPQEAFGGYFLYTMDAGGTNQTLHPLPPGTGKDPADKFWQFETRYTAWSPDGGSIAFVSYGPDGGYNKLYLYNLASSSVAEITPTGEQNPAGDISKLSWSWAANGGLAFDRWPVGIQIFTPAVPPGPVQVVPFPRPAGQMMDMGVPAMPGWSPDGKKMAFVQNFYAPNSDIGIFDMVTHAKIVALTPEKDTWPSWNPASDKIVYVSDGNLWVMSMTTRTLKVGDLNDDGAVDLKDALLALKTIVGLHPGGVNQAASVGGQSVGPADLVYILQVAAELRQQP